MSFHAPSFAYNIYQSCLRSHSELFMPSVLLIPQWRYAKASAIYAIKMIIISIQFLLVFRSKRSRRDYSYRFPVRSVINFTAKNFLRLTYKKGASRFWKNGEKSSRQTRVNRPSLAVKRGFHLVDYCSQLSATEYTDSQ